MEASITQLRALRAKDGTVIIKDQSNLRAKEQAKTLLMRIRVLEMQRFRQKHRWT